MRLNRTFQAPTMGARPRRGQTGSAPAPSSCTPGASPKSLAGTAAAGDLRDHRRPRRPRRRSRARQMSPPRPAAVPVKPPAGFPPTFARKPRRPERRHRRNLPGNHRPQNHGQGPRLPGPAQQLSRRSPKNFTRILFAAHPKPGRRGTRRGDDQNPSAANPPGARPPGRFRPLANSPSRSKSIFPPPARSSAPRSAGPHVVALIGPDRRRENHHPRQARRQSQTPRETPRRPDHARHLSHRRHRPAQEIRRHPRLSAKRRRLRRGTVRRRRAPCRIANSSSSTPPAAAPTTP